MTKYNLLGGGSIIANNNQELVEQLNAESKFGKKETIDEFMLETAIACQNQTGADIRIDSIDNFIEDLIAEGFIIENENDAE